MRSRHSEQLQPKFPMKFSFEIDIDKSSFSFCVQKMFCKDVA